PPRDLVYEVLNRSTVALAWTEPLEQRSVLGYSVYRNDELIANTALLAYADTGVVDGYHTYHVKAQYESGTSAASNEVEAFIEYPYPPATIEAVVDGADVHLSWSAVAGTELMYHLYKNDNLLLVTEEITHTEFNLANGSYEYYIITSNASESGASDPSETVVAMVNVPYPPRNLVAIAISDRVEMQWTQPLDGPRTDLQYRIYRDSELLSATTETQYVDYDLDNGIYEYYVTAVYDGDVESDPSNTVEVLIEILYPPTELEYTVLADTIHLAWTAAPIAGGERAFISYLVYRNGENIASSPDTSFTDANLANGIYQYYVTALYGTGESIPSNEVTALVEVLYPPASLGFIIEDDDILLSWQSAPISSGRAFVGYNVYRNGALIAIADQTSYRDAALPNGVYEYYVTALYDSGESSPTNTIMVVLEVLYPATGLSAHVDGDTVNLAWTAPVVSGGLRSFLGYKVIRNDELIHFTTETHYQDANLANGVYAYRIVANYDSGDAEATDEAVVTVEVLYPPSALEYVVIDDAVQLSWSPAPNSARAFTGYKVYRNDVFIGSTAMLSYTDPDLANGIYSYYVTASYDSGESSATNTVTANIEVLYPPELLSALVQNDTVNLSWTAAAVSGGIRAFLAYAVYRDGILIGETSGLTYQDNALTNGSYEYYVTARYDSGESQASNTVNALVEVLYPPANLSFETEDDTVFLSWTAAATSGGLRGFIAYQIYRDDLLIDSTSLLSYTDAHLANGIYTYYITASYDTGESLLPILCRSRSKY
ncbi:MAG: hypothetical protein U1C33_08985, partial [Candidatus Cloacimonadaceae bacterium]|nr:hypothetical protein [Candidatus Cloacimonadaceae bacterium]